MMRKPGRLSAGLAALAAFALTGCATPMVKPEAFGPAKSYAIVAIQADHKIRFVDTRSAGGGSTVSGLIKAGSKESGFSADAGRILADTAPLVVKRFGATRSFRLLPEKRILASKPYRDLAADTADKTLAASGYKVVEDEAKLRALAASLPADGVIEVSLAYTFEFRGATLPLVAIGRHVAVVTITSRAYDRAGNLVWKGFARGESDNSVKTVGEAANFEALHPLLIEATGKATTQLLEWLANQVGGPKKRA